jgi:hypothetical protein
MKKYFAPLLCAAVLAAGAAVAGQAGGQRFYGKITAVDREHHQLTVHNAKQKTDASFQWDDKTSVTQNKQATSASDLKVGQSLIVSYLTQDDVNRATRIAVRTPFKRAAAQ